MTRFDKFLVAACFVLVVAALDAQQVVNGFRDLVNVTAASVTTPAAGSTAIYVDSSTKKLATKDDAGNVTNYTSGGGSGYAGVNTQTTSYTLTSADNGKLVIMNCSTSCTATLYGTPTSTYESTILSIGSSTATVSLNSKTFNGSSGAPTLNTFRPVTFYSDGTNYFGKAPDVAGTGISLSGASNGFTLTDTFEATASGRYYQTTGATAAINTIGTANNAYVWSIQPTYSVASAHLAYYVATIDNSANLYDLGVLDSSGNLLCHIGATAGTTVAATTGLKEIAWLSSCNLLAGTRYYFAVTGNANTFKLGGSSAGGVVIAASDVSSATTTGGALPSSLTPPGDSFSTTSTLPYLVFY